MCFHKSIFPNDAPDLRHIGQGVIRLRVMNYRDVEGRFKKGLVKTRKHLPGMSGLKISHSYCPVKIKIKIKTRRHNDCSSFYDCPITSLFWHTRSNHRPTIG